MLPRLFAFLFFLQLAQATSTNTTTVAACPTVDATSCNYRSVWSLLASCGLTLLICVWHAIHPAVPLPHYKGIDIALYRFTLMSVAFFAPEIMIGVACEEWYEAKEMTNRVQVRGYRWWTTTHSHFVLNGGFVLRDHSGIKEIRISEYLSLVDSGDIANPFITEEDIKDKSTSDALGKAILVMQLTWFTLQIIVRLLNHIAVTLIELDTVCMALLTVPLIFFWWEKPRCPARPHVFYMRSFVNDPDKQGMLKRVDAKEKLLDLSTTTTYRGRTELLAPAEVHSTNSPLVALLLTWSAFGALHAAAWNYDFPTAVERTLWHFSSVTLATTPIIFGIVFAVVTSETSGVPGIMTGFLALLNIVFAISGVVSRVLLVALMLASLRALPSSAYETISWTVYIPHL